MEVTTDSGRRKIKINSDVTKSSEARYVGRRQRGTWADFPGSY